jgi:AAT family amino acid transporter
MSSEATAVSFFLRPWFPGISLGVIAVSIVVLVTVLNTVGASLFSRLEGSLAGIKLLALFSFIGIGAALIFGFLPAVPPLGAGALLGESFAPRGLSGIAGSMLIVMFSYAGFEVVGLAAPEARDPQRTVAKAVFYTALVLVFLYVLVMLILLPLIPTNQLSPNASPFIAALTARGLGAAARIFNIVMITAILSTMLASTFGLGRMVYALALKGHAPAFLKKMHRSQVPIRGILFSGVGMLAGVSLSFILPQQVYLFLVASGGYSSLFSYAVIIVTHYRFRKIHGCPPAGQCQLPGYPYTSWFTLLSLVVIILSMPLIPGQGAGLAAGLLLTVFYAAAYYVFLVLHPFSRLGRALAKPLPEDKKDDE